MSWRTAKRWAERYRELGAAGMQDRSSRPHRSPARTPRPTMRKIVHLRCKHRLGPVQIGGRLGMPASTVHAVLTRCQLHRLSHIDRVTGEPVRRYEHDRPGAMLHVDVTKYGNIPDGGGWRYLGRAQGKRHRQATAKRTGQRSGNYRPLIGTHTFGGTGQLAEERLGVCGSRGGLYVPSEAWPSPPRVVVRRHPHSLTHHSTPPR